MKKQENQNVDKVKELDSIIKSFRRRVRKHPEENYQYHVNKYSDEQVNELKRSNRTLNNFLTLQNQDNNNDEY